ncbi:MAG: hypothetical protein MR884_09275 [Clostridiales bacterium]|nr:hypothetical protein [Clostridiales bacterium]
MLNPLFTITALALIIAVVLMEIILARRCSSFKVVIPMIIIAVIICGLTAYASYLNKGYEYRTARHEMSHGYYAEITLLYDHGKLMEFSDVRIYNNDGIQVDRQWVDPEITEETDTEPYEEAGYFIKKYDLKGYSTISEYDKKDMLRLGNVRISPGFIIPMLIAYELPLLLAFASVRLVQACRRRKEEQRRLEIELGL